MKLRIESGGAVVGPKSTLFLDDIDLRAAVRGADIRMQVGDLLDVTLDVVVVDGLSFEGDVSRINVPAATADLLVHAGWLPPLHEIGMLPPDRADRLRVLRDEYRRLLDGWPVEVAAAANELRP